MYRYRYLDYDGNLQGPLWLSQMRELYHNGRLSKSTEITIEGSNEWEELQYHPEITAIHADLKDLPPVRSRPQTNMRRLAVWMWGLLILYVVYVVINWR